MLWVRTSSRAMFAINIAFHTFELSVMTYENVFTFMMFASVSLFMGNLAVSIRHEGAKGVYIVNKNKKDQRGIVIKNKARLVDQGYTQEERIDYDDVFASVARIEAIRLFLVYASFKYFVVYHMDVKSAFLYGKIEEEVYVCQPPGFEDPDFPDRVLERTDRQNFVYQEGPRSTAKVKTINEEVQLQALMDGKKVIIIETSVRRDLQLEYAENVDSSVIFLMYPRFVQVFMDKQVGDMSTHDKNFVTPSHTKKVFGNMKRVGKGFSRAVTPLFPTMMVQAQEEMGEEPIVDEASNEENEPTHSNDPLISVTTAGEVVTTASVKVSAARATPVSAATTTTTTAINKKEEQARLAREKAEKVEEANISWDNVQAMIEADRLLAERLQAREQEELTDEEKARLFVELLEKRKKHFAALRAQEKRNKPPTKAQNKKRAQRSEAEMRKIVVLRLIKSFNREDLETLWKLVKAKNGNTRPEEGYERVYLCTVITKVPLPYDVTTFNIPDQSILTSDTTLSRSKWKMGWLSYTSLEQNISWQISLPMHWDEKDLNFFINKLGMRSMSPETLKSLTNKKEE
ncbi:putative ribonuclease H-like domain-containing protein [Tanacetum coccineum]